MLYATLIGLHVLAAIVWVGGMFFAHMVLRPATQVLEPRERLVLFSKVFPRFFRWVWVSIVLLLGSGYSIVFSLYGGFANTAIYVHIMQFAGLIMAVLFLYLWFIPFRRFQQAVAVGDLTHAGGYLGGIRAIITINLILGLATSVLGAAGAYWG